MFKDLRNTAIENRRILVIDDHLAIHEDFRKSWRRPLPPTSSIRRERLFDEAPVAVHGESFELSFADQGEMGFHMVEQARATRTPYALAFVDMRMPRDGTASTPSIRSGRPIPIFRWWCAPPFLIIPGMRLPHGLETDRLLILRKPIDTVEVEQLAASLTCKWELAQRARLRIEYLNGLVDLRNKELQDTNARLEDVAARTAELTNRNQHLQQIVEEVRQLTNSARNANTA